jgi:hypothetical protein
MQICMTCLFYFASFFSFTLHLGCYLIQQIWGLADMLWWRRRKNSGQRSWEKWLVSIATLEWSSPCPIMLGKVGDETIHKASYGMHPTSIMSLLGALPNRTAINRLTWCLTQHDIGSHSSLPHIMDHKELAWRITHHNWSQRACLVPSYPT